MRARVQTAKYPLVGNHFTPVITLLGAFLIYSEQFRLKSQNDAGSSEAITFLSRVYQDQLWSCVILDSVTSLYTQVYSGVLTE